MYDQCIWDSSERQGDFTSFVQFVHDVSILPSVWLRGEHTLISLMILSKNYYHHQLLLVMVETSVKITEMLVVNEPPQNVVQPPQKLFTLGSITCFFKANKNMLSGDWNPREIIVSWCHRVNTVSEAGVMQSWITTNNLTLRVIPLHQNSISSLFSKIRRIPFIYLSSWSLASYTSL